MNKLKNTLLTVLLLITLPTMTYADCQSNFEKDEPNFKVTYEYNKDTDDFTIKIYMMSTLNYRIVINHKFEQFDRVMNGNQQILILKNYKNSTYAYAIKGNYGECEDVIVKEEKLVLKKTNPYVNDPLCKGNEDFILCQEDYNYDVEVTREAFESRLKAYLESKKTNEHEETNTIENKKDSKTEKTDDSSFITRVINYVKTNLINVIAITVFVIAIIATIVLKIKSEIKSRRLE